jgi:nucleoside-diphosphate-sugar epimerase
MKVLITGAYGFVGSNLSAYLAERGFEPWALDVRGEVLKCESSKVRESEGAVAVGSGQPAAGKREGERIANDANCANGAGRGAYARCFDWGQLAEIPWGELDAVIHLAGKAHDTRNASDPQSYFDVNVGLTKKVLDAWMRGNSHRGTERAEESGGRQSAIGNRQSATVTVEARKDSSTPAFQHSTIPVKTFILFSSVKAVADRVEGVLTEDAAPDPKTPYGQSKLEAEREVLKCESSKVRESGETTANNANQANEADLRTLELSNFRTYILRPCMIHGPGNKGNLNLLYGMVRKGIPWPLGGFENRRSFASIGNVCAVVEGLLKGVVASGVYQVADDETLSTNEVIGMMAESLGRRAKIWRVPVSLVKMIARVGDVLRLPLNSERLKKLTESYVVSNAKIRGALGWKKMSLDAREGMRKTLGSFGERSLAEAQSARRVE